MRLLLALFLATTVTVMSQPGGKKFLESYSGQSTDKLIAMAADHRIDSLVLAFEQALARKEAKKKKLSQPERDILAVEAMEREVNNGGYRQFFLNASNEHAARLPGALERIGCPIAAKIAVDALGALQISGEATDAKIAAALKRLGDKASKDLAKMDERYFQNQEAIADRLFAYIQQKRAEIVLN